MSDTDYDFVILGGGSAGYAAARTAASLGLKTAVVDGAEELGGLCILKGCMPSKTLIESANRNRVIRRAEEFGLRVNESGVHPEEIIARKRVLIADFSSYRQGQLEEGKFDLFRGFGRYLDSHRIEIRLRDGQTVILKAATSLIATGSEVFHLEIPGLSEAGYLVSDDILEMSHLPRSMAVLGGGAIAMEMAHYLEGVGVEVTLIQRSPHVLTWVDSDLADVVSDAFEERGMSVYTGTKLKSVESHAEGKTITFDHGEEEVSVTVDEILQALGRRPNTGSLGLENAGVKTDRGRIEASAEMASSVPNIFAAGDVCGPLEVVHLAIEQGEKAAHNAARLLGKLDKPAETMDYRLNLLGIFTEPQVASVGSSERDLKEEGRPYITASYPFEDCGKSMVRGETEGFVKLIADPRTGEILGGSIAGPEGVEIIHEIVVAMYFRATAQQLMEIPHYHPTLSEIWTYPAEDLAEQVTG